jgi:uncharacterized membrane protein YczE
MLLEVSLGGGGEGMAPLLIGLGVAAVVSLVTEMPRNLLMRLISDRLKENSFFVRDLATPAVDEDIACCCLAASAGGARSGSLGSGDVEESTIRSLKD